MEAAAPYDPVQARLSAFEALELQAARDWTATIWWAEYVGRYQCRLRHRLPPRGDVRRDEEVVGTGATLQEAIRTAVAKATGAPLTAAEHADEDARFARHLAERPPED